MSCVAPTINILTPPDIVFAISNATISRALPVNILSGCNNDTVPSCEITTANSNITTSGTILTIPPNCSIGYYEGHISCIEGELTSSSTFTFKIVRPDNFSRIEPKNVARIPDCGVSLIKGIDLDFYLTGGVEPSMIRLISMGNEDGDTFLYNITRSWLPPNTFTLEDVMDGLIYLRPSTVGIMDVKNSKLDIWAIDPLGTLIETNLDYIVHWDFCPIFNSSSIILESMNGLPVILTSELIHIKETHGLNLWNVELMLPDLPIGTWEYYCPDLLCDGPLWKVMPNLNITIVIFYLMRLGYCLKVCGGIQEFIILLILKISQ
jgi:hypothetical protein